MGLITASAETHLTLPPEELWTAVRNPDHAMWEAAGVEFARSGEVKSGSRIRKSSRLGEFCVKIERMSFNKRRESGLIVATLEEPETLGLQHANQHVSVMPEDDGSLVEVKVDLKCKSLLTLAVLACGNVAVRLQDGLHMAAERFEALEDLAAAA